MSAQRFAFLKQALISRPAVVSAVAALAAVLFASAYLSKKEARLMFMAEPRQVVKAASDIRAGEVLDESALQLDEVPRRYEEPGAIAQLDKAAGRIAMLPIRQGAQITSAIARVPSDSFGLAGLVPSGRRAFALSLSRAQAASGLVNPSDAVDVMATFDLGSEAAVRRTTVTLVEAAQVLAVDRRLAASPTEEGNVRERTGIFAAAVPARSSSDNVIVTLAVTPAESQTLAFAQESGSLALALRPLGEDQADAAPRPTTISSIVGANEELFPLRRGFREYRGVKK